MSGAAGKKITREVKPSWYAYFLLFVVNFGETVEIDFQFNFFAFLQLFPFGKIHIVFFCLGLAFLSLICSGYIFAAKAPMLASGMKAAFLYDT